MIRELPMRNVCPSLTTGKPTMARMADMIGRAKKERMSAAGANCRIAKIAVPIKTSLRCLFFEISTETEHKAKSD